MHVFIITLVKRVDRRLNAYHMKLRLEGQGFGVTTFEATDYATRDFRDIDFAPREEFPQPMTAGELACAWSHVRVCQEILKRDEPAFVLEDDAEFIYPLSEVNVSHVDEFMSLSHWSKKHGEDLFNVVQTLGESYKVVGLPYGTQCYYITPLGAEKFLEAAVPVRWPSDVALGILSKDRKLETYLAKSPVAIQHPVIASHIGTR